jgi:hypothetical protein
VVALEDDADAPLLNVPYLYMGFFLLVRMTEKGWSATRTRIRSSSAPVARNRPSGLKRTLRMYKSPVLLDPSSASTLRPWDQLQSD